MPKNQYHYFIAGLPDLKIDEQKLWTPIPTFKEILEKELEEEDFEQVKLVFLKEDNANLVEFLKKGEIDEKSTGNYSLEDFKYQVELFSAIIPQEDILPAYMVEVLKENYGDKENVDPVECSHKLANGYYEYVQEYGGDFLKTWNVFDHNLDNFVTFMESKHHAMDPGEFLTGTSNFTNHLREHVNRTLTKDPDFEYFTEILCHLEIPSIAEKEMQYDQMRWQIIDEMTFFEYFTIDKVMGYLLKMLILDRWRKLDHEAGELKL
ncbi:MAG: DUF2764 family protein, partial [Bacteroidales bacterium]